MQAILSLSPRFTRKRELLDRSIRFAINQAIERIATSGVGVLVDGSSHIVMQTQSGSENLYVYPVTNTHRMLYRISSSNEVEIIDIIARDDLEKFGGGSQ